MVLNGSISGIVGLCGTGRRWRNMANIPQTLSNQKYRNQDGEIFQLGLCECEHTILRRISPLKEGCNTKNIPYDRIKWEDLEEVN